jgi:acetyl-CoA acyltransferase
MEGLMERNPFNPALIDDVIWGCVMQTLEQGFNLARNAQLLTRIPHSVSAQTVNRLCGSSMTALHIAAANIMSGQGHIYMVGGVEHMGHIPMTHGIDPNPHASKKFARAAGSMGLTAEYLGRLHKISRGEQDAFAMRSHQNAASATRSGGFAKEIVPVLGHNEAGVLHLVKDDEVIRADTTLDALASLSPAFDPVNGTVTAGNSSAVSDGASGLLVMSESKASQLGLKPLARVVGMASAGCDPSTMGFGPVPTVHKILAKTGLTLKDIDLIELNEAFAAQSLAVVKALELHAVVDQKINLNGGAIALGHPLGCSGARIVGTLLHQMVAKDKKRGLATMCIGLGQGVATISELI